MSPIAVPVVSAPAPSPIKSVSKSATFYHTTARPTVVKGDDICYELSDGRNIIDASSGGALVSSLGNGGNEEIAQTMADAARRLGFVYHQVLGNSVVDELANYIIAKSKGRLVAAAFHSSGSEAIEGCIKTLRQYWVAKGESQRKFLIARAPSFHGNTLGCVAALYNPSRRDIYLPILGDFVRHVPTPLYKHFHKEGETEEQYSERMAEELEAKIQELGPENVMGFIAEPVVGAAAGAMPPPKGYFPAVKRVLDKHGLLLVLDEVMSGSGRTGDFFAHETVAEGVSPDIMAIAKGLGSGYVTISAILAGPRVHQTIQGQTQWLNSHTYQNHSVNCAVALKVLQIMDRDNLLQNIRERGVQLRAELKKALKDVPLIFDIRGVGLFVGIEYDVSSTLSPRFALRVKSKAMDNGLMVYGAPGIIDGKKGDATMLGPAYITTKSQITDIVQRLARSIKECAADI